MKVFTLAPLRPIRAASFAAALLVAPGVLPAAGAPSPRARQAKAQDASADHAPRLATLHAPWFFIDKDFHAIVAVKNCTDADKNVVLTVRFGSDAATDGTYEVPGAIRVPANRSALVDLRDLHDAAPNVFGTARSGGLELAFDGSPDDLLASVTMTSLASRLSFDVPFADPRAARSNRLDATWWFAGADYQAYVEMKNTTDAPVQATVVVTFGRAGRAEQTYTIPARQSRAVDIADFGEGLDGALFGSAEITHTGRAGAVLAQITSLSTTTGIAHGVPFRPRPLPVGAAPH